MFHNIFKKRSREKRMYRTIEKIKEKTLILADIHEKNSLVISELRSSSLVKVELKHLDIADYIISDIAIERKTISDFISSMINKRLIQQLTNIKKYNRPLLIIEGDIQDIYKKNDNLSKAIRGLIVSIINNHNIPILFSRDYKDSSQYLISIAKQQEKPRIPISLHSRIPKTKEEQKRYILEAFSNIGPKKSEKLLEKFKTLENIFNASEKELNEILKNNALKFKELLNS